jgi:hypothetical protein
MALRYTIDCAEDHHDVAVIDESGNVPAEPRGTRWLRRPNYPDTGEVTSPLEESNGDRQLVVREVTAES